MLDSTAACTYITARYVQEGVGRRAGAEMPEWIWSRGKPLFHLTRYMTPARWWDTINAFLAFLTKQLQQELPAVLEKRLKAIEESISECPTDVADCCLKACISRPMPTRAVACNPFTAQAAKVARALA